MNMGLIDSGIVCTLLALLIAFALYTKRFQKSVADFLVANRTAGRYMLAIAGGASSFGTISAIACFELYYKAGFVPLWWQMMMTPVLLIMAMTGWAVYRFRQTRAMTLAQFLEVRYSKRFRIFSGLLGYLSGVANFGIFPAVSANFFIYFCGFPPTMVILGFSISTFVLLMLLLLGLALFFTFLGGQITIMVTDFIQGLFCFIGFVAIVLFLMTRFSWLEISTAMSMTEKDASLLNPFHTSSIEDFNLWYYLIAIYGAFWNILSWQGNMGYRGSARNPHEAKMAAVVSNWRALVMVLFIVMLPVCAYTFMHHPDYAVQAQSVSAELDKIDNSLLRFQMIVPIFLAKTLPIGMKGLMCAVMLAALIATHNTYLHSWGSIFIQDVLMPCRNKPLTPKQHLLFLRCSIFAVAGFIFIFSLLFKQTEHILLYMAVTGAIFMGGAGTVVIGGLYWKRGSTLAAWFALIVGSILAVGGMVMQQIVPNFPINGQWMFLIAMLGSSAIYFVISLFGKTKVDMDKFLHRGKYAVKSDSVEGDKVLVRGWRAVFSMGKEFSLRDKILYIVTFSWGLLWSIVFVIGTIYNMFNDVKQESWFEYWRMYIILYLVIGVFVTIWVGFGGVRDMKSLFRDLAMAKRDDSDDGSVIKSQGLTKDI